MNNNELKILLANHCTTLLHGKIAAEKAYAESIAIFVEKKIINLPIFVLNNYKLLNGILLHSLLVTTGITNSSKESRNMIRNGIISINGMLIKDEVFSISQKDVVDGIITLSIGKKKQKIIQIIF